MASDMAMRSASFCSATWASALQFLTDSLRAVSNPADSRTMFFRHKEKNEDKKQSHKAGKTYLRPGHAAVRSWLGWTSQTRRPQPSPLQGSRPDRSPQVYKGGTPSASKFSLEKFSAKTTFVPIDCVDNRILMTSERDLERQGRPSRGTPTPPGYGYLTRHLPQKVAHARISDSATDEQVLMLETRGMKHGFIPKCSGLSSHKEQTHILRVTMVSRLRRRQRPQRFYRPAADV
jgi:hypothetical protein